jgi:imidazole glycerol-phosphate synthase subunit HisH
MITEYKPLIAIIDYDMGNLFSVEHACRKVGLYPVITNDPQIIKTADAMILPGVGAFGRAMKNLMKNRLDLVIMEFIETGKPFMGICLGFQLLFTDSEEFGEHKGLGIINGSVRKFPAQNTTGKKIKVPQIGWNQIIDNQEGKLWKTSVLHNIKDHEFMYFVHSYYPLTDDAQIILSITDYEEIKYCSSILSGNIFACQFHPEKSGIEGMKIYYNWAEIIKNPENFKNKT